MVKMRPVEQIVRRYVKHSLWAFLDGEQNLNWIGGIIRESGMSQSELREIFDESESYGNPTRYQEIMEICSDQGWL